MGKKTVVPIGPYHPLLEEPEFFKLYCDGETVVDMVWETGYNHRGIEKISESKTFEQVFYVVERICGICSTSHPFAYANAVESILVARQNCGYGQRCTPGDTLQRRRIEIPMWLPARHLGVYDPATAPPRQTAFLDHKHLHPPDDSPPTRP